VISEFLVYPTPTKGRKPKEVKSARVLTSVESRTLLKEKERKKREDAEAKEQRKQERLAKKAEKEEEKKRKQEERAAKAAERQKIAEEKAAKKAGTGRKRRAGEQSVNQGNPKKKKATCDEGLQRREISSSECAACFGLYEDDVDDDGSVTCDWIQCTNQQCSLWMHTNCLDKSDGEYVCAVCQNIFC